MNIFTIFFNKILAKYSPKRTKLRHFKKNSRGSMPPNPRSKRVASSTFTKKFKPPSPRNKILDTPLSQTYQRYQR